MSEVKKIATRESYGNALVELGKPSRKDISTVESLSQI